MGRPPRLRHDSSNGSPAVACDARHQARGARYLIRVMVCLSKYVRCNVRHVKLVEERFSLRAVQSQLRFQNRFVFSTRRAQPASPLPLQPRGVRSTRGGRWIDLEQPKQALVQLGAAHSPQRSFEQASRTTAAGQQGRGEVAPARQNHHGRPSGCCRKQWRRSWSSQAAAAGQPVRVLRISHFGESRRRRACPTTATHGSNGILVAESTTRATYGQVAVHPGRRSERQVSRANSGVNWEASSCTVFRGFAYSSKC